LAIDAIRVTLARDNALGAALRVVAEEIDLARERGKRELDVLVGEEGRPRDEPAGQ